MGDKLNSMAGGGAQGEANEDYLDKGELQCPSRCQECTSICVAVYSTRLDKTVC